MHWEELVKNLGGELEIACRAVLALLEAAITAQPSGKQNSFAAYSLPDLVLVEVSDKNLPVSYANAFLKPARASGEQSLMDVSVHKLADYRIRLAKTYALNGRGAYLAVEDYSLPEASGQASILEMQRWLQAQLPG